MVKNKRHSDSTTTAYTTARARSEKIRRQRAHRWLKNRAGQEPNENLAFLKQILTVLGFNAKSFALAIGTTQQNLHYFMLRDDISLSEIQRWFAKLNIRLRPHFVGGHPLPAQLSTPAIIWGPGILGQRNKPARTALDKKIELIATSSSRLAFVADLIIHTTLPAHDFRARLGICRSTFEHYFENDDMNISLLYKMARMAEVTLEWHIDADAAI